MEFLLQPLTLLTFFPLVGVLVILFMNAEQKSRHPLDGAGYIVGHVWHFVVGASRCSTHRTPTCNWKPNTRGSGRWLEHLLLSRCGWFEHPAGVAHASSRPISILSTWKAVEERVKDFMIFFLLLEVGMMGVFLAQDLFLFYIFWEFTLVPMYFLIGIWGGPRRMYAAVKFFLYTMAGSILMLLAIMFLGIQANTFNVPEMLPKLPGLYAQGTIPRRHSDAALHCLRCRLRHQSSDVAPAFVVARCPRGSAHRWFRHPWRAFC
jgi:NADH-quinone oxidoreductase subunit M